MCFLCYLLPQLNHYKEEYRVDNFSIPVKNIFEVKAYVFPFYLMKGRFDAVEDEFSSQMPRDVLDLLGHSLLFLASSRGIDLPTKIVRTPLFEFLLLGFDVNDMETRMWSNMAIELPRLLERFFGDGAKEV